jgi:hypothetical protein
LPEIRLRAANVSPPMTSLLLPDWMTIPSKRLAMADVPVGSVPMKLPSMTTSSLETWIALPLKPLMNETFHSAAGTVILELKSRLGSNSE